MGKIVGKEKILLATSSEYGNLFFKPVKNTMGLLVMEVFPEVAEALALPGASFIMGPVNYFEKGERVISDSAEYTLDQCMWLMKKQIKESCPYNWDFRL